MGRGQGSDLTLDGFENTVLGPTYFHCIKILYILETAEEAKTSVFCARFYVGRDNYIGKWRLEVMRGDDVGEPVGLKDSNEVILKLGISNLVILCGFYRPVALAGGKIIREGP